MKNPPYTINELVILKDRLQIRSTYLSRAIASTGFEQKNDPEKKKVQQEEKKVIDKKIAEIEEFLLKSALNISFNNEQLNS